MTETQHVTTFWSEIHFKYYSLLHPPLIRSRKSHAFAEPGFQGFNGGVFNPGAVTWNGKTLVMAKGQRQHWLLAFRAGNLQDFAAGAPILFEMDPEFKVKTTDVISRFENRPEEETLRFEDFRLFTFQGKIYSNHSMFRIHRDHGYEDSWQCLSVLDPEAKILRYLGQPLLDFMPKKQEKNWVYCEWGGKLHLFYSFQPYVVLREDEPGSMRFKTCMIKQTTFRKKRFLSSSYLSWSTNPVPYDDQHLLVVLHQRFNTRFQGAYFFQWAALIDRATLLPVRITRQPLFRGGDCAGLLPGVMYVTSTIVRDQDVVFFSGEGDSYAVHETVAKSRLNTWFEAL